MTETRPAGRGVRCRPIVAHDLPVLVRLLARGFPQRSPEYWSRGFDRMARGPEPVRFGFLLESGGRPVGVLLTLHDPRPDRRVCHLSSWYVEPEFSAFASLLDARATAERDVTYTNISPAPHTRPIVAARGFVPYGTGMVLSCPILAGGPGTGGVAMVAGTLEPPCGFEAADRAVVLDHAAYGCLAVWACAAGEAHPFVFARRPPLGRVAPSGHLVYCADVAAFVRFARPLGRWLLGRGLILATLDANGPLPKLPGRYFARGPKYAKGASPPRLGDLAYTEAALFGMAQAR